MKAQIKINEMSNLKTKLLEIQKEVVSAIFEDYPKLQKINLDAQLEYDDNNYQNYIYLKGINGVSWDDDENSLISCINCCVEEEDPEYRAWLVETSLSSEEFKSILNFLSYVNKDFLANNEVLCREDFLSGR